MARVRGQEAEINQKKWVVEQLNHARAVFYGLQANNDLPEVPPQRGQKPKKPDRGKIQRAREQMMEFGEKYRRSLQHPWYFEEFNGIGHVFEKPELEPAKKGGLKGPKLSDQAQQEMKLRLIDKLERIRDVHGNVPMVEQPSEP